MKRLLILLSVLITLSKSNNDEDDNYLKVGNDASSLLQDYIDVGEFRKYTGKRNEKDKFDVESAKRKAKVVKEARKSEEQLNDNTVGLLSNFLAKQKYQDERSAYRGGYRMDPVLNVMRRRSKKKEASETDSNSRSSSRELTNWKTEWRESFMKQKLQAFNMTPPAGDVVKFVAPRPWGVPCGDPGQHDMPWGSCVLSTECDGEYRIYRGDHFCGRTYFVCCSLQLTNYDTYQGMDVSLEDSDLQTDSAELRNKKNTKKKDRDRKRRRRMRNERKRKIRRTIEKIVKEIRKILDRQYRNGTKTRKRKTKTMRKFIRYLKKQYRKDRNSVKELHEEAMWEVDKSLMDKLQQIRHVNKNFMTNATFRDILMTNKMKPISARMLMEAYPELSEFLTKDGSSLVGAPESSRWDDLRRGNEALERRGVATRRSGGVTRSHRRKYPDYDIEYGMLYT